MARGESDLPNLAPEVVRSLAASLNIEQDAQQTKALIGMLEPFLLSDAYPVEVQVDVARAVTSHIDNEDEQVRWAVRAVHERAWEKVGIWHELVPPKGEQEGSYFEHSQFPWIWEDRVAILILAHAAAEGRPMNAAELEKGVFAYLGLQNTMRESGEWEHHSPPARLGKLQVVDSQGKHVPILAGGPDAFGLSQAAYTALLPYQQVLEAMTLVREPLTELDYERWREATEVVETVKNRVAELWSGDFQQLLFPNTVGGFEEHVTKALDAFLERMFGAKGPKIETGGEQMVASPVGEQTVVWGTARSNYEISLFNLKPEFSDGKLVRNFTGKLVAGDRKGAVLVLDRFLSAKGEYLPVTLPPEVRESADFVLVGPQGLQVGWDDVSGDANKGVGLTVRYGVDHRTDYVSADVNRWIHGLPHIGPEIHSIVIPDDTGQYAKIEVRSGKSVTVEASFEGEPYKVEWIKFKDKVRIKFEGQGWKRKIEVPAEIDPMPVMAEMKDRIIADHEWVVANREEVLRHRNLARQLTLEDEYRLMLLNQDMNQELVDSNNPEQIRSAWEGYKSKVPRDMQRIDFALQSLNSEQQWLLKLYIFGRAVGRTQSFLDKKADLLKILSGAIETTPGIPRKLVRLIDQAIPQGSLPDLFTGQMQDRTEFVVAVYEYMAKMFPGLLSSNQGRLRTR